MMNEEEREKFVKGLSKEVKRMGIVEFFKHMIEIKGLKDFALIMSLYDLCQSIK